MAEIPLLTAFGSIPGDHWFRVAFNWDIDQIFAWLQDVSRGDRGGPRAQDPAVQKLLKDCLSKIKDLSLPRGKMFLTPNLQWNSHFPRSANEDWNGVDFTIPRWHLHEWPSIYRRGPKDAQIRVPYWNPYDLLGYFLSLLGPAPQAANRNNYFLPLTAVYARWCSRIAGCAPGAYQYPNPGAGAGNWPFMYQCTWHDAGGPDAKKWFFLGASIGGDKWNPRNVGKWKDAVQLHRFNMVLSSAQTRLVKEHDYERKTAPEQRIPDGSDNPYGNCAETYPFVEKMFRDKNKNKDMYGVALQRDFMRDPNLTQYSTAPDGVIWNNVCAPCRNCGSLVLKAGARAAKFAKDFDRPALPVADDAADMKAAEEVGVGGAGKDDGVLTN